MMPPVPNADAYERATFCDVCGRESCEDHLPADAAVPNGNHGRRSLAAVRAVDLISQPPPVEIVEGIAWADCLTVLPAESGAGKTFVLLDTSAAVSAGTPWHGRTTLQGSVAYLHYEGDAMGLRLRALHDVSGQRLEHVYIIRASDPLSPHIKRDGESRAVGELAVIDVLTTLTAELAATHRPPIVLLVIDTIRASLTGSEDNSEPVSAYLRAVRRVMASIPGAAAILAHHAGWQDGETQRKRERGSSAWRGNCDATVYLEAGPFDPARGEAPLTLRTLKVRDAERPGPLQLIRRRVELAGMDRRGQPLTSCVIERDRRSREDVAAEAQATADREAQAMDLRTLTIIVQQPDVATSVDRIRLALAARKSAVTESVARIIRAGWVIPGRQRQPYTVTDAGRFALATGGRVE